MSQPALQTSLKVALLEPSFDIRRPLANLITQCGQTEVVEYRSYEDLLDTSLKHIELFFVNAELDPGMSGSDLVRFLTRMEKVSRCCKFVIFSQEPDFKLDTSINRETKVELLTIPTTEVVLRGIIHQAFEINEFVRPIIERANRLSPHAMVSQLQALPSGSTLIGDDIRKLKINVLLRASQPKLAYSVAESLNSEYLLFRELLHILRLVGDESNLVFTINKVRESGALHRTCFYYLAYRDMIHGNYAEALNEMNELCTDTFSPGECELYALLLAKTGRTDEALAFLDKKLSTIAGYSYHHFMMMMAKVRCLSWMSLDKQSDAQLQKVLNAIQEALSSDVWSSSKMAKQTKLFVRLGLLYSQGSDVTRPLFNKLYKHYLSFNPFQLNALLFVANKLDLQDESMTIHIQLEKRRANVEISPELLSFKMIHMQVLETSMTKEQQLNRILKLTRKHQVEGRPYRALELFLKLRFLGHASDEYQAEFDEVKQQLGIEHYWKKF